MTQEQVRQYGKEFYEVNSEWSKYRWDKLVAESTVHHKTGYISQDIQGICTRTIAKCIKEMRKLEERMDEIYGERKKKKG